MSIPAAFNVSEMALAMQSDGVEVRSAPAGDSMTLVWISCPKGFDFGPALKGLPHDMCMPSFPEDCAWYEFTPTEHVERLFSHMGLGEAPSA